MHAGRLHILVMIFESDCVFFAKNDILFVLFMVNSVTTPLLCAMYVDSHFRDQKLTRFVSSFFLEDYLICLIMMFFCVVLVCC